MNIKDYLERLDKECSKTLEECHPHYQRIASAHNTSACIQEFSETIKDDSEKQILKTVSSQIEASIFSASIGLYRPAFSTLRLAFEMGLGVVYFSINKLELQEWLGGEADIKWSSVTDNEKGIFSKRFAEAFLSEAEASLSQSGKEAKTLYRKLSEYVHGNKNTWSHCDAEIKFKEESLIEFLSCVESAAQILFCVLSCRYLNTFSAEELDNLDSIQTEIGHHEFLRKRFGGPTKN